MVPQSPASKIFNEKHHESMWGKGLDPLGWEDPECGNLPLLISHGGSYQKIHPRINMFAMSWQCPTAEKIISTITNGSEWLESLKTTRPGYGNTAGQKSTAGRCPHKRKREKSLLKLFHLNFFLKNSPRVKRLHHRRWDLGN